MIHGVRPPLTARTKRPRAATAARASAAIVAAAARATESTSSNTWSFMRFSPVRSVTKPRIGSEDQSYPSDENRPRRRPRLQARTTLLLGLGAQGGVQLAALKAPLKNPPLSMGERRRR